MMVDYFLIKRKIYDVPALYDPHGIYGTWNWRSASAMLLVIVPVLPALANNVTPDKVPVPIGLSHLFTVKWLYVFFASGVLYYLFNLISPDQKTLIPFVVYGDTVEGADVLDNAGSEGHSEKGKQTWVLSEAHE